MFSFEPGVAGVASDVSEIFRKYRKNSGFYGMKRLKNWRLMPMKFL